MSLKLTLKNLPHTHCCDKCTEEFKSALHLKYHKFRVHNGRRPYVCKECHKSFRRINYLQQHRRRHKSGGSTGFTCDVCDSAFSSRKLLSAHNGVHVHTEGDHECGYCCATFLHLAEARLHVLLVHSDASILPPERARRPVVPQEEVFCVKEGAGLKIKLKRKLSVDVDCGYNGTPDDLNPGSHTSDSGKGNSDMDEEDLLRNGNHLLRTPTFVPRSSEHNHKQTHSRVNTESGLLMKPKLEVGQTQWGSSKIQPTLTSKDFLTKTKFAANCQAPASKWGGGGLGFASPTHGSVKSLSPANSSCSGQEPSKGGVPQPSSPLTSSLTNSSSLLSQTKLLTAAAAVLPAQINGALTIPSMFPGLSTGKFGSTSAGFGVSCSSLLGTTAVGFGLSKPVFTTTKPSVGFGTTTFGTAKTFGISSTIPVFSANVQPRNGELLHQPVFGSKEKVRSMVAKADEVQVNAFEQYAGSTSGTGTSNPFADAMKKAKNPSPKRYDVDSERDSSSYYSGSDEESGDSGLSTSSQEDQEISDIEDTNVPLPVLTSQTTATSALVPISSVTTTVTTTSSTSSCDTPLQWMSPRMMPSTLTSTLLPPPLAPSSPKPSSDLPYVSPPSKPEPRVPSPTKPSRTPTRVSSRTPSRTPVHRLSSPRQDKLVSTVVPHTIEEEVVGSQSPVNASSHAISPLPSPKRSSPTKINTSQPIVSEVAQMNGDVGGVREVSGIIDLDTPSMSISVPKTLLQQARNIPQKTRNRRASSTRSLRKSSRTPSRSTCATPTYHAAKTSVPPSPYPEYTMPPTPSCNDDYKSDSRRSSTETLPPPPSVPTPSAKPIVSKHKPAPTKPEVLARMRQQAAQLKAAKSKKSKIGPKCFMRKINGRVFSDSKEDGPPTAADAADAAAADAFYRSEMQPCLSGRTDQQAPYESRFKQNQLYLCYLRKRCLDLINSLFPQMRVGGNFCLESDDVEGLLDYVTLALENRDSSTRCISSMPSKRKQLHVALSRSTKQTVRVLQRKVCKLIRIMLPGISLKKIEDEGINTLPKLIHKVITENT